MYISINGVKLQRLAGEPVNGMVVLAGKHRKEQNKYDYTTLYAVDPTLGAAAGEIYFDFANIGESHVVHEYK